MFFSWQHMPRVSNVTKSIMQITLFNNDNSEAQLVHVNGSTGQEFIVNFDTMHVSLDRKLKSTAEVIISRSAGSYQPREQSHALVG